MAKRFRFRFETMLKIRRQREDEHKRIVSRRLAEIAKVREELARLEQLTHGGLESIRTVQQAGRIDLQQAMAQRGWVAHLHKASLDAQARLGALEACLVQERAALAEASKQRRILEKLEETQRERHRLESERQQIRAADDLTTTRLAGAGASLSAGHGGLNRCESAVTWAAGTE